MEITEDTIIIHPRRGKREQVVPDSGLLLVTPAEAKYGHRALVEAGGVKRFLYNSELSVAAGGATFIAGPAVGAPMAVMSLEKLIALGARKIIMFGWCGALDPALSVGDVVIGASPVSGEGTSGYYQTTTEPVPSESLTMRLKQLLDGEGLSFTSGKIWSTDAPYREDRNHLAKLREDADVIAVDMEYSALCAVSSFRGVEFAAVFLVSDELYNHTWRPGFTHRSFRDESRRMVNMLAGL